MALPSVGSAPRYIEEIKIGGGYGSSPDGGVDVDKAGNMAADGDLTVGGTVDVKGGTIVNSTGVFNIGAGALINHTFTSGDVNVTLIPFDQSVSEDVCCTVALPADYDGSSLTFAVYWTSRAGTSGTVRWGVNASIFDNDESLAQTNTTLALDDTFIAQNDLHVISGSATPSGASTGNLLTLYVRRLASFDTLDDDADFIGIRISYT